MTDFDLLAINETIFGGNQVLPEICAEWFLEQGVTFPCRILANDISDVQADGRFAIDQLTPGLAYIFLDNTNPAGEPCRRPQELIGTIQQAIIAHRRRSLAGDLSVGELEESQARQLAVGLLLDSDQQASQEALEQWLQIVCHRHQRWLHALRRKLIEMICQLTIDIDSGHDIEHAFKAAVEACQSVYTFNDARHRFPQIITTLVDHLPHRHRHSPLCQQALDLMRRRAHEAISLGDVATALHVHPAHLARVLKRETGQTCVNILQDLRVALAKDRLQDQGTSILRIALDCGFPSPEHFHRVFKRLTGQTPRRWRLSHHLSSED